MSMANPQVAPLAQRCHAFDLLATLVAVVDTQARVCFANAALEDMLGLSRRALQGASLLDYVSEGQTLTQALADADKYRFSALRYDARLLRANQETTPVHVIVAPGEQANEVLIEFLPQAQQARQDREDRMVSQAQAHKELIRNLAHGPRLGLGITPRTPLILAFPRARLAPTWHAQ